MDELDGILLSAIEEIQRLRAGGLEGAAAEEVLVQLWCRTFSAYAAVQEDWLERAFVRRGRAIVDQIYPDANERTRLYQYGFTPYVGRRFEAIAPDMKAVIESAQIMAARVQRTLCHIRCARRTHCGRPRIRLSRSSD